MFSWRPRQISYWSNHIQLFNENLDPKVLSPHRSLILTVNQSIAVDKPHFLGPVISTKKDRPVRIVFYNLLPEGADGDLFLPKDSTIMGSGPGPNFPGKSVQPAESGHSHG